MAETQKEFWRRVHQSVGPDLRKQYKDIEAELLAQRQEIWRNIAAKAGKTTTFHDTEMQNVKFDERGRISMKDAGKPSFYRHANWRDTP